LSFLAPLLSSSANLTVSLRTATRSAFLFRPRVKEGAYGESHTLTVNVTYDSSHDTISGTFLAKGEASVSISSLPAPPAEQLFNLLPYALVAVIVGSIVALAAVLLQRR